MADKKKGENPALGYLLDDEEEVREPVKGSDLGEKEIPEGYKLNPALIEKKSQRVQLLLQPSLVKELKKLAKKKKTSMNGLISEILKEYIEGGK